MDTRARVGRNIRRLRVEAGMSQEAIAVDSRLETTHVSRIERGLANPTLRVLDQLAEALGVDIEDLFERRGTGRNPGPNLTRGRKSVRTLNKRRLAK